MKAYLLFSLILLSSCSPKLEKAIKKVTKTPTNAAVTLEEIHKAHPTESTKAAARWNPVKTSSTIKIDTVLKEIVIKGDSIPCPEVINPVTQKPFTTYVRCPDVTYFQRTISEHLATIEENTAALNVEKMAHDRTKDSLSYYKASDMFKTKQLELKAIEGEEKDKMLFWTRAIIIGMMVVGVIVAVLKIFV